MDNGISSYDTSRMRELGDSARNNAKMYMDKLNEITNIITVKLSSYWNDEAYVKYVQGYQNYLNELEELNKALETFGKTMDTAADAGDETTRKIDNIIG